MMLKCLTARCCLTRFLDVQLLLQLWYGRRNTLETIDILGLSLVEETLPEVNATRRVVRAFLTGAGASAEEAEEVNWGAERAHQALQGIDGLISQKYDARRLQPQYAFRPVNVPVEPRPMPTDVLDRYAEPTSWTTVPASSGG